MKKIFAFFFLVVINFSFSQNIEVKTLLKDNISIRAIQVWDGKVWYAGTHSKFGYVSLKDTTDKKQIKLSNEKLEFRTLAQTNESFYTINIGSPAYWFIVNKKNLEIQKALKDTVKTVFYDAFVFDRKLKRGIAISDPNANGSTKVLIFTNNGTPNAVVKTDFPTYHQGEAHFAASNSNIALKGNWGWIATGGTKARIFKFNWNNPFKWKVINTPFIQGTATQGIYSLDFYDKNFGIAVGGDYTKQSENIDNIATTNDGGETWQIQASGKNEGYKTCVKIRPHSKGKDIIAVGDQSIELSTDYGKTWKKISDEKGLYVCEWINKYSIIFAGNNRILLLSLI